MADLNPDWTLDGKDVDVRLGSALTGTDYTLSVDSTLAVTISLHDQRRTLLKSGILDTNKDGKLDQGIEITLDGAVYRLASAKKSGDTFSLGFEDRIAARLRDAKGQLKPRDGEGHVRFAQRLVKLVGGEFVTPTGVAVATDSTALGHKQARAAADERREKGLADEASVTVKGARVNSEQIRNIEVVLGVCAQAQAGPKATLACVEACIVESTFRNLKGGDADSVGILQVRVSIHGAEVAKSVERSVKKFLNSGFTGQGGAITLASQHAGWSAGEIAQAVQGSAYPGRYDQVRTEAADIIDTYEGLSVVGGAVSQGGADLGVGFGSDAGTDPSTGLPTGTPTAPTSTKTLVQRGTPDDPNESSWDALQRISKAKGYRCFALRNRIYYAREQDLIRSRPRMTLTEDSAGVDWIDWEWSPRKALNVATIQCRASLWAAPPGSAVILKESGGGNGRWLVSSFKRSRDFKSATIELRRGTELLQPPQTKEKTSTNTIGDATSAERIAVGDLTYPLPVHGKDLGGPAAHAARAFGNWQSDNAVDIGVPQGTDVFAVANGTITRLGGAWKGGRGNPDGFNVTLKTYNNSWFYTHLKERVPLTVGQKVTKGQRLGKSGAANGVNHLHIGCLRGDPEKLLMDDDTGPVTVGHPNP